jgi:hypothetical protein
MFNKAPPSSPQFKAAAWAVALVGVVAWTYYEQQGSTGGEFSTNEAAKWNERVKSKTKTAGAGRDGDGEEKGR